MHLITIFRVQSKSQNTPYLIPMHSRMYSSIFQNIVTLNSSVCEELLKVTVRFAYSPQPV